MKMLQRLALCGMAGMCAMGMRADQVTVFNGAGRPITVAIVQGAQGKKDKRFRIHGELDNNISYYQIQPLNKGEIERPGLKLSKDTMLLIAGTPDQMQNAIEENYIAKVLSYKIGQIGNSQIFVGPGSKAKGTSFARAIGRAPSPKKDLGIVALYKSYQDMAKAISPDFPMTEQEWQPGQEEFTARPIVAAETAKESEPVAAKAAWPQSDKATLRDAFARAKAENERVKGGVEARIALLKKELGENTEYFKLEINTRRKTVSLFNKKPKSKDEVILLKELKEWIFEGKSGTPGMHYVTPQEGAEETLSYS